MRKILLAALPTAVFAAGPTTAQQIEQQLVDRGKTILTGKCSRCHQVGATGRSALAIAPPFRALMQQYAPEDLEEALAEGLTTGHPAMPEFEFDPDEIAAILAYLGTLREKR